MASVEAISPDLYREERYRHGKFTCDICLMQWPMAQMRIQHGLHIGSICCFEPDGDAIDRDLRRAAASIMAAQRSAEQLQPPKGPDGAPYSGLTDLIDTDATILTTPSLPVVLAKGGAPVAVVLVGINFTATDAFTYPAGITDSVPPSLSGTTQWTLSVQASGGMTAGLYPLIFGPLSTIWQGFFAVH